MARVARVVIAGLPHHITQRGNRRQQTFFNEGDYAAYLELMSEWCRDQGVEIWSYCLMPNHTHLIAVPSTEEGLRWAIGEAHRRYTFGFAIVASASPPQRHQRVDAVGRRGGRIHGRANAQGRRLADDHRGGREIGEPIFRGAGRRSTGRDHDDVGRAGSSRADHHDLIGGVAAQSLPVSCRRAPGSRRPGSCR